MLVASVVRPGYLPVPLVLSALPLIALLAAGTAQAARRFSFRLPNRPLIRWRLRRGPALTAGALMASIVVSLWLPAYPRVVRADDDAPMRQAQQWITANIPRSERLIVDDALWVDLVRDGRDRRNVVWSYKVDTDPQVQALAPNGWSDYDWVVSTPSMRAKWPAHGVLTDAFGHSRPVVSFGSGGQRVDLLHVDNGSNPGIVGPAAPTFRDQLAVRLGDSADPRALAVLQSPTVDQRVVAALAVIAATEPLPLQDIPAISGEDTSGTPRRELTLAVTGPTRERLAAYFKSQVGSFAAESVAMTPTGLRVRFPIPGKEIGLGVNWTPPPDGPAALRVADLRPEQAGEQLNLVRVDGTAAGSLQMNTDGTPSAYHTVPAGTYIVTTQADGKAPVIRQVINVNAGATYTLTLFSPTETAANVTQLVPDTGQSGSVRLMDAARATSPVRLAVTPTPTGNPTVLADGVKYGLVTGYAPLPAGDYTAVVTANGQEWRRQFKLDGETSTTLLLADGPDGPRLQTSSDAPGAAGPLGPPTLTIPPSAEPSSGTPSPTAAATRAREWAVAAVGLLVYLASTVWAVRIEGRP